MGNKTSHDEASDEGDHGVGIRDLFKHKTSHNMSLMSKAMHKKDEADGPKPNSSKLHKANGSDGGMHAISTNSPGMKPDGIAKLAKELVIRSQNEVCCGGISVNAFTKYLCHSNSLLGQALFRDCFKSGKCSKKLSISSSCPAVTKEQFVIWAQKMVQLIGDENVLTFYIQIFSSKEDELNMEDISHFLQSCYCLSMGNAALADNGEETAQMVLTAMFHGKSVLGLKYAVHWIAENCPRVVTWVHRNLIHQLTVGFRQLQKDREAKVETESNFPTNLETPVLDINSQRDCVSLLPSSILSSESPQLSCSDSVAKSIEETLNGAQKLLSQTQLHQMQIWLLGCTLPLVFTRPNHQKLQQSPSSNGILLMDPHTFITRMNPTHWNQLYNSDNDGLSLNRFEHHVMGYRGPTVTFFYAEDQRIFCLAVDQPWKESINFWGSPNTIILKISPEYRVLDRGEKIMYYNMTTRGYPFGMHFGSDHRDPHVAVDKDFSCLSYRKIPYRLESIQVWGCGTSEQRESQLDHKKWEMKQVEKSRQVKLSAVDWSDHPDKCLLEMAGSRPNYSQFSSS